MDNVQLLDELLINRVNAKEEKIIHNKYQVEGLAILKIRDILMIKGKIYLEDLENSIYLARINGGWRKRNPAYLAIRLVNNELCLSVYAREGIINQHTSEGVINDFKNTIEKYIKE